MAELGTVFVDIKGDWDQFEKESQSQGSRVAAGFKTIGKAAGAAVVAGATAAVGAGIKGIVDFTGFERQMNEVFTLLPNISGDAMQAMTGQVKDFSREFGVLPNDVIPALYQSISAGVPQDNVFEFLETAQMAAKGGVTELTTAVDGISSVINAYGTDVLSATQASDLMFTAVRLGKTNFDELSQSLFNVTPTTAALGVEFQDVTAALAAMTAQGVPTSVATTQLRQLFVELSKEGTATSDVFKEIAGTSFKEFVAAGGNTQEALQLLEKHAKDSGVGINDLFGSVEAGSAALALTGQGTEGFTTALDEMGESTGATQAAFETMDRGLGPIWDRFKANLSVVSIELGQRLAPIIERVSGFVVEKFREWAPPIRDFVTGALTTLGEWWDTHGPTIVGFVTDVADAVRSWVTDVIPPIRSWVEDVLRELGEWWDQHGPTIIALVVGIGDAVATAAEKVVRGVQWIVNHWDDLRVGVGIVAGLIAAVLIPHFVALGVQATISAAKQAAAWVTTQTSAIKSAVVHSAQVVKMVARWLFLGAQAALHAAKVAAAWLLTHSGAVVAAGVVVAQVARQVAQWVILGVQSAVHAAKVAAGWVVTSAGAIAAAAVVVAQVAVQVAAWALLGVQALLHAAKVAAAWLIAMGPIAIVIAAVIALVALIIANWETIKAAIAAGWNWVKDKTAELWAAIKAVISAAWEGIKTVVSTAVDKVVGFVTGIAGRVSGAASTAFDALKTAINTVKEWVGARIDDVVGFFTGLGGRISSAAAGMFDGIKNAFKSAINWIIRAWNGLEFSIPGFDPPGPGPTFGGFTLGVPNIPELAEGAVLTEPTLAMLAEIPSARPEIVTPERLMRDIVAEEVAKVRAGDGPEEIHAHLHLDGREIHRAIIRRERAKQ